MEEQKAARRNIRNHFSTLGLAFAALVGSGFVAYFFMLMLEGWLAETVDIEAPWWVWLRAFVPTYLVGMPVCFVLLKRRLPARPRECHSLKITEFLALICIGFGLIVPGNWSMNALPRLFGELPLALTLADPLRCVVSVTVVPLLEELVFRKLLIDRIGHWDKKLTVLLSGVIFGLFRLNFFCFLDGFILGAFFACAYLRTGRLRYPVILSAIINLTRLVITPGTSAIMDALAAGVAEYGTTLTSLWGFLAMTHVIMLVIGLSVFGIVLTILRLRRLMWKLRLQQLLRSHILKTAFVNVGMIVYIALCLLLTVLALF